jgi:hypothetical protein
MLETTLSVRVVDGGRQPFQGDVLITLFDGNQQRVHWAFHKTPNVVFTVPLTDGPADVFRVIASADNCKDAGQLGVELKQGTASAVDLMLLPRKGSFVFQPLASLSNYHKNLLPLVQQFLRSMFDSDDQKAYEKLQRDNEEGLATLLSISSAFQGFGASAGVTAVAPPIATVSHPLDFVTELVRLEFDRFFAKVSPKIVSWLSSDNQTFAPADFRLHPGAFLSYKEQRYPEGNVQFTFIGKPEDPVYELDSDIDLFKDQGSHFFLEILPTDVFHVIRGTDPRDAYAFRWMSVQRAKPASGLDFIPPYSVQSA